MRSAVRDDIQKSQVYRFTGEYSRHTLPVSFVDDVIASFRVITNPVVDFVVKIIARFTNLILSVPLGSGASTTYPMSYQMGDWKTLGHPVSG